jgi:hypothetical protein
MFVVILLIVIGIMWVVGITERDVKNRIQKNNKEKGQ